MRSFLPLILCLWLLPNQLPAQIFPLENDTLNYTLIGFQFQSVKNAKNYTIEIASGHFKNDASFKKNIITTASWKKNKGILQVPSFAKEYTWRVIPSFAGSPAVKIKLHHFSTGNVYNPDTAVLRFIITHHAEKYKDAYLMMDGNRTMYDMEGHLVWYLPDMEGIIKPKSQVRDLKLSPFGTLTLLVDGRAFETDYNGRILWEGPNGRKISSDTMVGYHHELTMLSNGHFMVLETDPVIKQTTKTDSTRAKADPKDRRPRRIRSQNYGVVTEYNENGKPVWEWRSANYFKNSNLDYYKKSNGMSEYDIHENSFYFDEKNKVIYVSFRNISQVLKVSYPSGEVIAAYGKLEYPNDSMENHIFCGQHSCHVSEKGYFYVYDNGCGINHIPKIVMMKLPSSEKDTIEKIWEYPMPVEPIRADGPPAINSVELNKRYMFTAGGNVVELSDNSFFVSSNVPYNKALIVSQDKQILWSAEIEKWQSDKKSWVPYPQYRISIIPNRELLENLIWNSINLK